VSFSEVLLLPLACQHSQILVKTLSKKKEASTQTKNNNNNNKKLQKIPQLDSIFPSLSSIPCIPVYAAKKLSLIFYLEEKDYKVETGILPYLLLITCFFVITLLWQHTEEEGLVLSFSSFAFFSNPELVYP